MRVIFTYRNVTISIFFSTMLVIGLIVLLKLLN